MGYTLWLSLDLTMSRNRKLFGSLGGLSILSGVSAIATYGFMAIVARRLGQSEFGIFTFAWSLTYTLSGSFLAATEAEGTRLILNYQWAKARQITYKAAIAIFFFAFLYSIFEVLVAQKPPLGIFFIAMITLLVLLMLIEVTVRACFASQMMRFRYGLVALIDSLIRLFVLAALLVTGVRLTPVAVFSCMTIGTAITALIAVLLSSSFLNKICFGENRSAPIYKTESLDFIYLLASTLAMTGFVSGVPLIIGILSKLTSAEIGVIGAALMIARVPLLLCIGFESILVQEFHHQLLVPGRTSFLTNLLLSISLLLGSLGGISGYLLGPWLVARIAGPEYIITSSSVSLLSMAIGLTIGAMLLTPLCIALSLHKYIAISWLTSLTSFVALVAMLGQNILRVGFLFSISSFICVILLYFSILLKSSTQFKDGIYEH